MPDTNKIARLARVLANLTETEARAVYAALGQYVDNQGEFVESCQTPDAKEVESLKNAESVLGRLDAEIASLAA